MQSPTILAHLMRDYSKTEATLWHGSATEPRELFPVYIRRDEAPEACEAGVILCPECVTAHSEAVRAAREAEEKKERERHTALQRMKRREREQREIIKEITGEDLAEPDLPVFLVDAYRRGGDFMKYLDALKAVDDAALEDAGLTSWDLGDDE